LVPNWNATEACRAAQAPAALIESADPQGCEAVGKSLVQVESSRTVPLISSSLRPTTPVVNTPPEPTRRDRAPRRGSSGGHLIADEVVIDEATEPSGRHGRRVRRQRARARATNALRRQRDVGGLVAASNFTWAPISGPMRT